jgi:hypothetical protein
VGSALSAGGNLSITATTGNIDVTGSSISAANVAIAAAGVVIDRNTRGSRYTFTSSSPDTRPKGVPPADLSLQFDGIDHVTEWVDPITMIPARIDIPEEETTIVRAGISY